MDSRFKHNKYDIQVHDAALSQSCPSDDSLITSGVLTFVYTAGTKTLATLYADEIGTTLANPISRSQFATDDKIKFYAEAGSVDLVVCHEDGSNGAFSGITPRVHKVDLDRAGADKLIVIPFVFNNNVETDTGIDFPLNSAVYPPIVEVVTVDATETLDVGLLSSESNGDANGLLAAVPLDNAVFIRPWATTDGASEDYVSAPYLGALIGLGSAGTNTANDFGQPGGHSHIVSGSNAKSITYTCSSGSDTAAGYLYLPYKRLR